MNMKIWTAFSGDFTGLMKIIGNFKSAEDASVAADAFNAMLAVKDKTVKGTGKDAEVSDELRQVLNKHALPSFSSEHDLAEFEAYTAVQSEGNKIVTEQNGLELEALLKVLVSKGAKIELYRLKDYPDE